MFWSSTRRKLEQRRIVQRVPVFASRRDFATRDELGHVRFVILTIPIKCAMDDDVADAEVLETRNRHVIRYMTETDECCEIRRPVVAGVPVDERVPVMN